MIQPATLDARRRRPGFTLIELLVVILIIGILMGLLIPAINIVMVKVREARVSSEIQILTQSIANYTSQYGDLPSRIVLWEANVPGAYDPTVPMALKDVPWYYRAPAGPPAPATFCATDLTLGQLNERSLTYLRKRFPKVAFPAPGGVFYDFNGNGVADANPILLEGHECLVFFLGGIPTSDPATGKFLGMAGFSKFPQNPFVNATNAPNRNPASDFDFSKVAGRLFDDDGDGIPGLADPLGNGPDQRFYAYFSAYGGGNFDPNDENFEATNPDDQFFGTFQVTFVVPGSGGPTNIITNSPAPNPYTSSLPAPPAGLSVYQSAATFQLISAGRDKIFGMGGEYLNEASGEKLPPFGGVSRQVEGDNITNFTSGRLE